MNVTFDSAFNEVEEELTSIPAPSQAPEDANQEEPPEDNPNKGGWIDSIGSGVVGGIASAAMEASDFFTGEPEEATKSQVRKDFEQGIKTTKSLNTTANITLGISQFVTGMVGLGKITKPIKAITAGRKVAAAREITKAATVGAVAFDPHEERLSNLIESYPSLRNPVTAYLAADPEDSAAEGRFKAAIESIGMDLTIVPAFLLSLKGMKALKNGSVSQGKKLLAKASKIQREARAAAAASKNVDAPAAIDKMVESLEAEVKTVNPEASPTKTSAGGEALDGAARDAIEGGSVKPSEAPGGTSRSPVPEDSIAKSIPAGQAKARSKAPIVATPEDIAKVASKTVDDVEAAIKHGGREAAQEAGHKFDTSAALPWKKLRSGEEVQAFIDNTASVLKSQMDAKKGGDVMKDAKVATSVKHYADLFGEDPDLIIGELAGAGEASSRMVARMEASYVIANRMFQDAYKLASDIKNGIVDSFEGGFDEASLELQARLSAASDVLASARSMSSNAGRSLRRMRTEFKVSQEDMDAIKNIDPQHLVDALLMTKGDPKMMAIAATRGFTQRLMDGAQFSLANSLLWLYPTHVVNTVTNGYMLFARPLEKLVGSSLQHGFRGSPLRDKASKEFLYTMTSISDAYSNAVEAFTKADSVMAPHRTEYFDQIGSRIQSDPIPWSKMTDLNGLLENMTKASTWGSIAKNAVGLPTRGLGTMDEFFKQLRYRAVVQAEAASKALSDGLTGKEYSKFIQKELDNAFDVDGRAINPEALNEAAIATFQQDLLPGTGGAMVKNARANFQPMAFILPFVKTPVNVLRYSVKMTPGLNLLQTEYRKMLSGSMGKDKQAQAIGQMTLGATGLSIAASLAMSGRITGGGPAEVKLKKELMATGWKPYSFIWKDEDGKTNYFPLGRFDPVGMPFGMVADLVEMQTLHPGSEDNQKGIMAVVTSLAKNFSEKTFLLNFNQALRAMTQPEKNMAKFFGGTVGNTLPLSSLTRGLNPDPYLRDARGFIDNMMRNVPGYSETLPPVRDAFGEPIWRSIALTSVDRADKVEQEHNRIILETGHGITPPSAIRNGVDLRDVALKNGQTAFDRLQELSAEPTKGKKLKDILLKVIQSEKYQLLAEGDATTKGTKLSVLAGVVSDFRQAAFDLLKAESPELQQLLLKKQMGVVSQIVTKRAEARASSKKNPIDALKEALNISN